LSGHLQILRYVPKLDLGWGGDHAALRPVGVEAALLGGVGLIVSLAGPCLLPRPRAFP
jgi:hypothetical protein